MARLQRWHSSISALLVAGSLFGCGGGGGGAAATAAPPAAVAQEPGAPALTNITQTDGLNWFNFRRGQIGIPTGLTRNALLDKAAQNHSDYQALHGISHTEDPALKGFTGVGQLQRQRYVGYVETGAYAFGEVIAQNSNVGGVKMAEELIAAIYHRFVIFEPMYREAGAGAATSTNGAVYFTTNFGANNGFGKGIGRGKLVSYPFSGQTRIPLSFLSNTEIPDPFPDKNEVGYPISVHADLFGATEENALQVSSFTVRQRGAGVDVPVRLLSRATDPNTRKSGPAAAAIIPNDPLRAGTVYDVSFSGRVDSADVTLNWSFTTK